MSEHLRQSLIVQADQARAIFTTGAYTLADDWKFLVDRALKLPAPEGR